MNETKEKNKVDAPVESSESVDKTSTTQDFTSIIKNLESQGYVVRPKSNGKGPVMSFENPPDPYPEAEYTGPKDEYERILVQVTDAEVQAGINKLHQLRQDGWEIECQIFEGRYRMKKPRKLVMADREKRINQYRAWLKPQSIDAPSSAGGKGTKISNNVEQSGEVFTTEEIMRMTQSGIVPPAVD